MHHPGGSRRDKAAPAFLLDMTHRNPGDDYPASRFVDPQFLAGWGYNGQVIGSIGGLQTFDEIAPGLLPEGSGERNWAMQHANDLRRRVQAAHAAGLKCFAGTDMILLPKKRRPDAIVKSGRTSLSERSIGGT